MIISSFWTKPLRPRSEPSSRVARRTRENMKATRSAVSRGRDEELESSEKFNLPPKIPLTIEEHQTRPSSPPA
jgi:hypothetical protein